MRYLLSSILIFTASLAWSNQVDTLDLDESAVEFMVYLKETDRCEGITERKGRAVVISKKHGVFNAMALYCYYMKEHAGFNVNSLQPVDIKAIDAWLYQKLKRNQ